MRYACCLLLLLMAHITGYAQAANVAEIKATVKAEATQMGKALVEKDYDNFIKTTHPLVIKNIEGGTTELINQISEELMLLESEGSKILKVWPGEASNILDTAKELQCTIPQYMEIKVQGGTVKTTNKLIALSQDKGRTWYFIDAAGHSLADIKEMFPTLSSRLDLSETEEPIFTADE